MPTVVSTINAQVNAKDYQAMRILLDALIDDVDSLRVSVKAITAKLDLDAGVTDTDYNTDDPADATATKS